VPADLARSGTPPADLPAVRVDGLVRRAVIGLLDTALSGALFALVAWAFRWFPFVDFGPLRWNWFDYVVDEVNANLGAIVVSTLLFLLVALFVNLVAEVLAGASLGRLLLGGAVLDTRGRPASLPRLLARNVFRVLEVPLAGLGLWLAFVLPSKRALHDLLSGTVVGRPR
jgi:uncharacterized RDD family membrane protein YckC